MKYIMKETGQQYNCYDLGGSWICETEYYGGQVLLIPEEDFRNDFKPFNALEINDPTTGK